MSDYDYICSIPEGSGVTGIYQDLDVTVDGYIATIENRNDTAATSGSQPVVIHYYAQGETGGAGARGVDGGAYTVDNYDTLALVAGGSGGVGLIALVDIQAKGGDGGDAKRILIRNETGASIEMGSSDGRIAAPNGVQAIKAYAAGGDGGSENGERGAGGTIDIANDGVIDLWLDANGQRADPERSIAGIYAESLGGSGQSSSDNSDAGGAGEPGRPIVITNSGRISLDAIGIDEDFDPNETSAAIFALSRGGNGGASPSKNIGGAGGGAGLSSGNYSPPYGAVVSVETSGTIATRGDGIMGVVIRTRGGDGGDGNGSDDSRGGAAGAGGESQVSLTGGSISTDGDNAYAIVTQSIGGIGGGDAATAGAGGAGGAVGMFGAAGASIATTGDFSSAVTLHSVGGGDDFTGVLYGSGGDGGITLSTAGDDAYGILAQSIGGGGGIAGAGSSEAADDDDSHQLQVSVGVGGGSSGNGGAVTVGLERDSSIATLGDRAFGIVAQSIGGGVGGASHSGSLLSVSVGGRGGSAGDGAHGVVAQSIGGGDASGPNYSFRGIKGSDSATGQGRDVTVTADGTIRTTGTRAHGIVAQSVSGGGGILGDAGGISYGAATSQGGTAQTSGKVTIGQEGTISATGFESIGILAQSSAGATPGDISVTVDGDVTGGTGANGAGVMIMQGHASAVYVNQGAVVSAGDAGAWSVRARVDAGGFVNVYNSGTMNGDVSLQSTDGDLGGDVHNDGTWTGVDRSTADDVNSGTVDLVAEPGEMTAARSVAVVPVPPAPDRAGIDAARIRGHFTQTREGALRVTGDFDRRRMDLLKVDGAARLGGTLLIEPVTISPDAQVRVVSAGGGLRGRFDEIESVLFEFAQIRSGREIAIEAVDSDFAAPELGLDAQQAGAGRYLDGVFDAGGEGFGAFFAGQERLARLDPAAYAQSLSIFAPGATLAPAAANFDRARSRLDAAQGCDGPAEIGGGGAMDGEGRCRRMLGGVERRDQQGDASGAFGYDGSVWTAGVAGQAIVAPGWILGGAAGYEVADYSGDTSTSAEGGTGFLSVTARHEIGAWGLSAGVGGSWGAFDLERRLAGTVATAETEVWSLAGRVRADWTMALPHGWFRPSLDVDVVHSAAGGYAERGRAR